jgi:pimeloyl-ACP methyl ester carboxylesterase
VAAVVVRTSRRLLGAALGAALVLTTACGSGDAPPPNALTATVRPGQLAADPTEFYSLDEVQSLAARALKIRYHSTSGVDGSPTVVSGVMFVPKSDPPPGGWPIVSIGHPTAGLHTNCAPSSMPGLMGNLSAVIPFLTYNFVVVMTDYQGLGAPGTHPYLEPKTAAYNVIDAVRAARNVEPKASDTWLGYGLSQGGQAVWSANELAGEYGKGLRMVGSFSMAPATDLRPMVDAMVDGTLTTSQKVLLPMVLEGVRVVHPDLDIDDYLHGDMRRRMDVFTECAGEDEGLKARIAEAAKPADTMPSSPEAAQRLRDWLGEFSVPQRPATAPMLVAYGGDDQVILPAWTEDAVRRACAMGDVIDAHLAPGQGHGVLELGSLPTDWLRSRFTDTPAPNTCATP